MAKKLGDQYIVGSPNRKVGGPVSPGPYGCCSYVPDTKRAAVFWTDYSCFITASSVPASIALQ